MAQIYITLTDRKLFTLYPDGTDMVELLEPSEYKKNAIGERKRIELSYNTSLSVEDSQIYFDPAIFRVLGASSPMPFQPPYYWGYYVDPGMAAGTYQMILTLSPPYLEGISKNWDCKLVYINSTNFTILFEYFQLYDLGDYIDPSVEDNQFKLLKSHVLETAELTTAQPSVYTTNIQRIPQFYIYINSVILGNVGYARHLFRDYAAGFYNQSFNLTAPYFTLPVWALEVNSLPVTTFQLSDDTKVTFGITAPGVVDKIFIWLIKTNTTDNTVDFIQNYDASYLNVVNDNTNNTLDNKIKSPSTGPTLNAGKYEVTFYVDHTKLLFGEKYRFIAVVYESGYGNVDVNSFISDEYFLNESARFDGQNYYFNCKLRDYNNTWDLLTDQAFVSGVVEERFKSTFTIGYDYQAFSSDIFRRLGLVVPNDIRRYLTKIKVEAYNTDGTYINYYDRLIAAKVNAVTYDVPDGLTLTFNTDEFIVDYDYRNRYESWIPNIETRLVSDGSLIIPPVSNQNWALIGSVTIKFSFELFYDDALVPFSDTLTYQYGQGVNDYDCIEIVEYPDTTISDNKYFCLGDEICLQANFDCEENPEDYSLIVTVEPFPGNSVTIEENEEYYGYLPKLNTDKVLTQEVMYSETVEGAALFCLDSSKFILDIPYKISAMAKLLEQPIVDCDNIILVEEAGGNLITNNQCVPTLGLQSSLNNGGAAAFGANYFQIPISLLTPFAKYRIEYQIQVQSNNPSDAAFAQLNLGGIDGEMFTSPYNDGSHSEVIITGAFPDPYLIWNVWANESDQNQAQIIIFSIRRIG